MSAMRSDLHRVGAGLSVRFSYTDGRMDAEWAPRLPTRRELPRVLASYVVARNRFLAELAQRSGGVVVCVGVQP